MVHTEAFFLIGSHSSRFTFRLRETNINYALRSTAPTKYDFSDSDSSDDEVELYWDKLKNEKKESFQELVQRKRKFEEIE